MRIEPASDENDPYRHLDPLQKVMRRLAIVFAFGGVFYWFIKVVFG